MREFRLNNRNKEIYFTKYNVKYVSDDEVILDSSYFYLVDIVEWQNTWKLLF